MTSYVTREEYERLEARLKKLEAGASGAVNITLSGGHGSERIAALVREGVQRSLREYETRSIGTIHGRYTSMKA